MTLPRFLAAAFAATLLPALASSQGPIVSQNMLVGWAASGTSTTPGTIDVQPLFPKCLPDKIRCTSVHLNNMIRWAGGTAYNPADQTVWTSDGNVIEGRLMRSCGLVCKMKATKVLNPLKRPVVSGLAIANWKNRMFQLETYPGMMAIVTYARSGKCWKPIAKCALTLGGNWVAGGLAYDEPRDLLYYTISQATATGGWQNVLMVARANTPCKPFCKIPLKQCFNGMITGLAYDCCTNVLPGTTARGLYATYGNVTQRLFVFDPFKCQIKIDPNCCKKGNRPWRGLAIIPGWKSGRFGKSCSGKPCPNCPLMTAGLAGGDPSLGNSNFRYVLGNAPGGKLAFLFMNGGNCTNGVQLGNFCGLFYPALVPSPFYFGPTVISGMGCLGSAVQPLPIPPIPSLCGRTFCGQFLVLCFKTNPFTIGFSMSNAVSFTVTSS